MQLQVQKLSLILVAPFPFTYVDHRNVLLQHTSATLDLPIMLLTHSTTDACPSLSECFSATSMLATIGHDCLKNPSSTSRHDAIRCTRVPPAAQKTLSEQSALWCSLVSMFWATWIKLIAFKLHSGVDTLNMKAVYSSEMRNKFIQPYYSESQQFIVGQKWHKGSDITMENGASSLLQGENNLKALLTLGTSDLWLSFEPLGRYSWDLIGMWCHSVGPRYDNS
jgi:hypothetical protein